MSWCVVDNFCLCYYIESLLVCHEGTDALAEVTDLDVDIPQEGAAHPSFYDNDCFRVHFGQKKFHGKP